MGIQASAWSLNLKRPAQTMAVVCAFLAATASLTFALLSAPERATDLGFFYDIARAWLSGDYNDALRFSVYPPPTPVIFSPFALFSFDTVKVGWFVLNLLLSAFSIHLAIKLIGPQWPWQASYFLYCLVLTWAPFRVNLRNGQITVLIATLLLGSLLAWRRDRGSLAGLLLGIALCKPTLTLPFLLYFLWKRQWKVVMWAASIFFVLTAVFALRLGINPVSTFTFYVMFVGKIFISLPPGGDLSLLILSLTGDPKVSVMLSIALPLFAVIALWVILRRTHPSLNVQLALVALFALWSVYHRTYDFIFCLIPAAVLIDFVVHRRLLAFSYFWLACFSLLALGLPGFAANRVGVGSTGTPWWVSLLVHSERLFVLGIFWSLLWVIWHRRSQTAFEVEHPLVTSKGEILNAS